MTPGRLILADPSNDTPPIFLAVAKEVAVPALPEASPVTLPVKGPVNLGEVTIPANVALPLFDMVAAVPTSVSYTHLTLPATPYV